MQDQPIPNSTANESDRSRYSTDFGCSSDHFEHSSTISRNQPILKTWHSGGVDVWQSVFSMTTTSSKTKLVNYFLYWLLFVLANIYYILANIRNIVVKFLSSIGCVFILSILARNISPFHWQNYNVKPMFHFKYL